jgi:hypothetical protein
MLHGTAALMVTFPQLVPLNRTLCLAARAKAAPPRLQAPRNRPLPRRYSPPKNEIRHNRHSSSPGCQSDPRRVNLVGSRPFTEGKRTGQRPDSKSAHECENAPEIEAFPIPASEFTSPEIFLPSDPSLAVVAQKWAALPAAIRAGILAIVAASIPDGPALPVDKAV